MGSVFAEIHCFLGCFRLKTILQYSYFHLNGMATLVMNIIGLCGNAGILHTHSHEHLFLRWLEAIHPYKNYVDAHQWARTDAESQ